MFFKSKVKLIETVSKMKQEMSKHKSIPADMQKAYIDALEALGDLCRHSSNNLYGFKPHLASNEEIYQYEMQKIKIHALREEALNLQHEIERRARCINSRCS